MSNRIFQSVIHQMKDVIGRVIGVVDESGTIVSCSELGRIGEVVSISVSDAFALGGAVTVGGYTYRSFGSSLQPEFTVFVEGTDALAEKYASVLSVSLSSIKQFYDEKYDRGNFIKNVMLDNILPGDIYLKGRELHFNNDAVRVVFLIRLSEPCEISVFEMIQSLFPDKNKDFVVNINETDIAVIKEISAGIEVKDLEKLARSIIDSLNPEVAGKAIAGIGTQVKGIKDLAKPWRSARSSIPKRSSSPTKTSASRASSTNCRRPCAKCSCARSSSAAPSSPSTTRRCSPSRSSSRTTSTSLKRPVNCSSTETRLSTVSKRSANSRASICASSTTPSFSKWR